MDVHVRKGAKNHAEGFCLIFVVNANVKGNNSKLEAEAEGPVTRWPSAFCGFSPKFCGIKASSGVTLGQNDQS